MDIKELTSGPDKDQLAEITALAENCLELRRRVAVAQQHAANLAAEERQLSQHDLPEAMKAVGMKKFALSDGTEIAINHKVKVSLPKAKQDQGFAWLRENGHGALIKERVVQESVHPQTLSAFGREQLAMGQPLPENIFSVYEFDETKIKTPE